MSKWGPIIIIDDDQEDQEILKSILQDLKITNEIIRFNRCGDAFDYLRTMTGDPFIIFCDVNLPMLNGIDFKRDIDEDEELKKKSIPFVFYSSAAGKELVDEAYTKMTVQGFFKKGTSYSEIKETVRIIVDYWKHSRHPSSHD